MISVIRLPLIMMLKEFKSQNKLEIATGIIRLTRKKDKPKLRLSYFLEVDLVGPKVCEQSRK